MRKAKLRPWLHVVGVLSFTSWMACARGTPSPSWNQYQGDPSSTGQKPVATKPAKETDVETTQFYDFVSNASPVLAPDGAVWLSSYFKTANPYTSSLLQFTTGPLRQTLRVQLGGQLTTPAVDKDGNVYVTQFLGYHEGSHLLSFDNRGTPRWDYPIARDGQALVPPKVLAVNGGSLIFTGYSGGSSPGWHLLIVNDQNTWNHDVVTCHRPPSGFEPGFRIPPIALPGPFLEDPAIGIATLDTEHGQRHFVVVVAPSCGISIYSMNLGASAATPPTLSLIDEHDSDEWMTSPAISVDGVAVIVDADGDQDTDSHVTGYDIQTGEERWKQDVTGFVSSTPTMMPTANLFVYIASSDRLIKLDLSDGHLVAAKPLVGPSHGSPAAGGQYIFVNTPSGLLTYDLDLNFLAFAGFAGGSTSPAIGASGEVYVASADGWLRVFAGL